MAYFDADTRDSFWSRWIVLAFMFSIILLSIAAVLILVLIICFWWKTRHLSKRFRDVEHESKVIDGESRRDD